MKLEFFCDNNRHLVCKPFSIENLHRMADELNLKRCWYHSSVKHPHYDIPIRRIKEIQNKCTIVQPQEILRIIKEGLVSALAHNELKP